MLRTFSTLFHATVDICGIDVWMGYPCLLRIYGGPHLMQGGKDQVSVKYYKTYFDLPWYSI